MSGVKFWSIAVLGSLGCSILQLALAQRFQLAGFAPDWTLLFLSLVCQISTREQGAVSGFFVGLTYGAAAGANLMHYVISRTVAAFVASWLRVFGIEPSPVTAGVQAGLLVLFAQLMLMFLAPPTELLPYIGVTIRTALANGGLAMLVFWALRRFIGPHER